MKFYIECMVINSLSINLLYAIVYAPVYSMERENFGYSYWYVLSLPYWSVSIVNTIVSEVSVQFATHMGLINAFTLFLLQDITSACTI